MTPMLELMGMTLADRIGGGWPRPEHETCDHCDQPNDDDQHLRIIGQSHLWLCGRCYRKSLATTDGRQATLEGWA